MTNTPTPTQDTTGEIADLLAWARSLSEQGPHADPRQPAALLAAKAELLARITDSTPTTAEEGEV